MLIPSRLYTSYNVSDLSYRWIGFKVKIKNDQYIAVCSRRRQIWSFHVVVL